MIKKILLAFSMAAFAFALTACGGGDYPRRTDETNTLYVGYQADSFPTSFMPWLSREGIAPTVSSMVYNTLFTYNDETGGFDPIIGKEWYYVCPDGEPILTEEGDIDYERLNEIYDSPDRSYLPVKIVIHDDVTWSDGTPLTVEDIHFTLDTATNNAISNHAGALAWTADLQHRYRDGRLIRQGIFTYENGAAEQGYHIAEEDKDTVMYLHVDKILGAVTSLFTTILILPEHIWGPIISADNPLNSRNPEGELLEQYQNPVGSGPWELDTERSGSQQIILHRRDEYHRRSEDGGPLYNVETIRFQLYQEINVAIYALLKGHIDVLNSSVSSNYMRLFEGKDELFVSNAPGIFTQSLVLNVNPVSSERNPIRDLLADKDFRKAIALAVNQQQLIDLVLNGAGSPGCPGLMPSHLDDFYNPDSCSLPRDPDERLTLANEILDGIVPERDDSGYRLLDGERVAFDVLGHPGEQDLVSFLEVQMEKIGIEVNYAVKGARPERTYLYNSRFDMTLQGVIFSLQNVDIMYRAHFVQLGETSNYGRLQNETLTTMIERMRRTLDLNEKYDLIYDTQPLIASEFYKIPLYTANVITVARTDRYTNWQVETGASVFNTTSLENLVRVEEE